MLTRIITKHISVTTTTTTWYYLIILHIQVVRQLSAQNENYPKVPTSTLPLNCGIVPLHKKLYNSSLNETMNVDLGNNRILNGLDAVPGEWPWIVRLKSCDEKANDGACMTCTGTLLSTRWIISAGHCAFAFKGKKITATLGLYDLVVPDETSFTIQIDKVVLHPLYNDLNNDLALFRLKKHVVFNDFVQPACLVDPIRNMVAYTSDKVCYTVGYGLNRHMISAIKLQKFNIRTKNPSDCNKDRLGIVRLRRGTVCIGPAETIGGSCKGDSGGPDLCYDTKKGGRWVLFGTVSYGPSDCDRNDDDDDDNRWLTVSVNLASFRSWILTAIALNHS